MARARARTENIETDQLEFFVEEFCCKEQASVPSLGAHDKVMRWKIRVVGVEGQHLAPAPAIGAPPPPDEDAGPRPAVCQTKVIEVHVSKGAASRQNRTEVSVVSDFESIFPGPSVEKAMSRMKEDFNYNWKFRGTVPFLGRAGFYQLDQGKLFEGPGGDSNWIECTIQEQRPDGLFEISAAANPSRPSEMTTYPGISPALMRTKAAEKPLEVPQHVLAISVPKDAPHQTTLLVDNRPMTLFLGRGSPKGSDGSFGGPTEAMKIFVEKDRKNCTVYAGHSLLTHYLSGEPMAGEVKPSKLKKSWVLQLGPFAEHVIEIEEVPDNRP